MNTTPPPAAPALPATNGLWQRLVRGRRVLHADADWEAFAGPGWEERIMTEPVTDRFHAKQGRSIGRWTLTAPDGRRLVVYLKRHYVLPRWRGLMAALLPGRAWSPGLGEWDHLRWARAQGLPVPATPAVGELLGPWGKLQSFLAVEELPDMLPLHEAVPLALARLAPDDFARWKRGLVAELARLARELHRRGAFHRDLYLCHFYIAEADTRRVPEGWVGRVFMIDFHRLARPRVGRRWAQAKDLGQLLFSTLGVPGITPRDRVRFWKLYRRGDWAASAPPGWLARAARLRARRYEAHNAKHSAGVAG